MVQNILQLYLSFLSFGPATMSPQHAHCLVVVFQSQNRYHRDTRLCPYNVLNSIRYIPCCQFLPVVSYRSVSSPPLSSSLSAAAVARALAPARSISSCSQHLQSNQAPGLRTFLFQRSIIGRVKIY